MMYPIAAITPGSMLSLAVGATAVGVLYALHHLRAQPVRKPVATLIFWKEATRKQQARVPWARRLTHFWTFALLSLICISLAASLSADQWMNRQKHAGNNAIVIDTGCSMTATDGRNPQTPLSRALRAALVDLDMMPVTPAVISAGIQPMLLVQPSDPLAIAKRRLASLQPSGSASASALALNLAGDVIGPGNGIIYWYTDHDEIPAGVATAYVPRVKIMRQQLPIEAVAILGADFVTQNGNQLSGTLHVRVAGASKKPFAIEEQQGTGSVQEKPVDLVAGEADISFDGLQANGQVVTLKLKGAPGAGAEQATTYELPLRVPLKFQFIGTIPRPLRLALLAIGTEAPASDANVVVVEQGQTIPAKARAVIKVVEQGPAIKSGTLLVEGGVPALAGLSFEDAAVTDGPAVPYSLQPLLRVSKSVVAGLSNSSGRKTLYLSKAIVGEDSLIPRHAAFPVLVYRLSTDLAGWSPGSDAVTSLRQVVDPLWNPSGKTDSLNSTVFEPPLLASIADKASSDVTAARSTLSEWPALGWTEIMLAIALLLLVFEGSLYASKKIV
jgi:hypothetical protein